MPHTPLLLVKRLTTVHRPYPLVGMIAPWNFPFAMAGMDVPPALAAGAAVLLKPSEVTPLSGVEFVRGWTEIGAPPVLRIATGAGADRAPLSSPTSTTFSSPGRRPPAARSRWAAQSA